jgi:hypothetical protein
MHTLTHKVLEGIIKEIVFYAGYSAFSFRSRSRPNAMYLLSVAAAAAAAAALAIIIIIFTTHLFT